VRIFAGGLYPATCAKSLRAKPDGKVLITDGPYLETKEHIGGFWVLEAADMDEPLAWGARPSSPVGRRSRCESFTHFDTTDSKQALRREHRRAFSSTQRDILFSLLLRLCIEKVVHHRDDDVHALHQGDVCRLGQYGQSRF
jgi:YCII-related domain